MAEKGLKQLRCDDCPLGVFCTFEKEQRVFRGVCGFCEKEVLYLQGDDTEKEIEKRVVPFPEGTTCKKIPPAVVICNDCIPLIKKVYIEPSEDQKTVTLYIPEGLKLPGLEEHLRKQEEEEKKKKAEST